MDWGQRKDAMFTGWEAALLAANSVIFLCGYEHFVFFFGLVSILQPENL